MKSKAEKTAYNIACKVDARGGRTFYVGGFVRDKLLGISNKDVDIEVHGIEAEMLCEILSEIGNPIEYGSSFGIYSIKGEDIDIALPRKEKLIGVRHRDFEIEVDPFIGTLGAARRRDFTMNSLMEDVLTGEIVDHFGGIRDIKDGVIRHIDSQTFIEDPLRVLRAAQFAARFIFTIAEETIELCRNIDLSQLSKERVEEELRKALCKSDRPSIFFESLRRMDKLADWFPELESLIGLEQDAIYHPEGDVWTHTMEVIDRAVAFRDNVGNPFAFMLFALTHDLGKIVTTEEIDGRIHSYKHEKKGQPLVEAFVRRITNKKEIIEYLLNMVPLHMRPNVVSHSKPKIKSTNRLFDAAIKPEDLIWFAQADKPVFSLNEKFEGDPEFLQERLKIYEETMAKPYVKGRDLIDAGFEPSEYFNELLEYAHKLRLAGVNKDLAMKQILGYAKELKKKGVL